MKLNDINKNIQINEKTSEFGTTIFASINYSVSSFLNETVTEAYNTKPYIKTDIIKNLKTQVLQEVSGMNRYGEIVEIARNLANYFRGSRYITEYMYETADKLLFKINEVDKEKELKMKSCYTCRDNPHGCRGQDKYCCFPDFNDWVEKDNEAV